MAHATTDRTPRAPPIRGPPKDLSGLASTSLVNLRMQEVTSSSHAGDLVHYCSDPREKHGKNMPESCLSSVNISLCGNVEGSC